MITISVDPVGKHSGNVPTSKGSSPYSYHRIHADTSPDYVAELVRYAVRNKNKIVEPGCWKYVIYRIYTRGQGGLEWTVFMDSGAPLRIMLSDDHPFVRRGLRNILESTRKYEVCGEAGDGKLALELAVRLRPDILITDISMPPPNGLELAAQLHRSLPQTKILIMTMHDSEEMLRAAAAAGVSGYLLKSDAEELLPVALRCLERGLCYVSPSFDPQLVKQLFE